MLQIKYKMTYSTILFTILLFLKLFDQITLSWIWVFAPYWIPLGLVMIIAAGWIIGEILTEGVRKK